MANKEGTKGQVDVHTRILSDMNDGASDWEEIRKMLYKTYKQGITHVIAASRYISGQDTKRLREMTKRLKETAFSVSENMVVNLGQEVQYFEELPSFLGQGKVLASIGSRYVLVEFLPGDGYTRLFRTVRRLVQSSYLPVIAHAGWYDCLKEKGRTEELAGCGIYLQMNIRNLGEGLSDRRVAWCRKETLKGNIHFIATDMRGVVVRLLELEEAVRWMTRQDRNKQNAGGVAKRLLRQNQEHIPRDPAL